MEGVEVSMVASVDEQQNEGSSNSATELSTSVTEGHGEEARVQKKRKGAGKTAKPKKKHKGAGKAAKTKKRPQERSATWLNEETDKVLQAYLQISQDKGRFRRTSARKESFWEAVSQKVQGRTSKECQRRIDTLTKSWKAINEEKFEKLDDEMLRGMKLATGMTVDWYNQMCEIKKKPDNTRVVSTETGLVEEGEQSNASSPVFAPGRLIHEQAAPVPHQQDSSRDFMTRQPPEAPNYSSSAGEDEQLHQIPCPGVTALVQALVPGAQVVVVPSAPPSPEPHQDANSSPQPAVDAASSDLDLPNDFATEAVGSVPCLEVVRDVERISTGWNVVDISSLRPTEFDDVPSVEDLLDFDGQDTSDMDILFHELEFGRLRGF